MRTRRQMSNREAASRRDLAERRTDHARRHDAVMNEFAVARAGAGRRPRRVTFQGGQTFRDYAPTAAPRAGNPLAAALNSAVAASSDPIRQALIASIRGDRR